ncbi:MAG: hypothetical protein ACOX8T_10260 [Bacillota bacterium]|jgi:hypothetical protein
MKYGEALQRIVMDDYLAEDYAIRFAIEELYKYIPAPTWLEGGEPLYEMTLVVDPGVLPSDDGYRFEPCPGGARMVASHRRGLVYGLFQLTEMLRLGKIRLDQELVSVEVVPAFPLRIAYFYDQPGVIAADWPLRDAARLLKEGFNAVAFTGLGGLVDFRDYNSYIAPPGSEVERISAKRRDELQLLIERAKRCHLRVYLYGEVFLLPKVIYKLYGAEILQASHRIDAGKPQLWEIYRALWEELFTHFPTLDGVIVRIGEMPAKNYPHCLGEDPVANLEEDEAVALYQRIIGEIIGEVVERHGKEYIQRAWYPGERSFHADPEMYDRIMADVDGKEGFYVSLKHTKTGYWPYQPWNPNLNRGKHAQIVECACQWESEGKGAFPAWAGSRWLGGEKQENGGAGGGLAGLGANVKGIWAWITSGNAVGPVPRRMEWLYAHVYALARLAWNPRLDEESLIRDWAVIALKLKPDSPVLTTVVAAMKLSAEVVQKASGFAVFPRLGGPLWDPVGGWFKDDQFGNDGMLNDFTALCRMAVQKGGVEAAVAEKDEAERLFYRMNELWERVFREMEDRRLAGELRHTLRYMEDWVQLCRHWGNGYLRALQYLEGGGDLDHRLLAEDHFQQAAAVWERHQNITAYLPGVAAPLREMGMVAFVRRLQKLLAEQQKQAIP